MKRKRINVVLDLDQTLIYGEELNSFDVHKHRKKMLKFKYEMMQNFFIIFERPGLQQFLDFLFNNFNVAVWTAATKDYALFVVNHFILVKPNRKLDFIFHAEHCNQSILKKKGIKDLCMIWDEFNIQNYSKKNTILIDDNPDVLFNQYQNVLEIKPFIFHTRASYRDVELEKIENILKLILANWPREKK